MSRALPYSTAVQLPHASATRTSEAGTITAARRRRPVKSRSVNQLTPDQHERKKANDREAQRVIREKNRLAHEASAARIKELEEQLALHQSSLNPDESNRITELEERLTKALHYIEQLEERNRSLQASLSASGSLAGSESASASASASWSETGATATAYDPTSRGCNANLASLHSYYRGTPSSPDQKRSMLDNRSGLRMNMGMGTTDVPYGQTFPGVYDYGSYGDVPFFAQTSKGAGAGAGPASGQPAQRGHGQPRSAFGGYGEGSYDDPDPDPSLYPNLPGPAGRMSRYLRFEEHQ